ncbi:MAG: glycoside hydrolase family 97 N-terminal domain-containing protein, partial [Prevotella sp.]|nr:glycoside hydrolase family 97 N-terminal domain-containing protein [Prevotella sp.]
MNKITKRIVAVAILVTMFASGLSAQSVSSPNGNVVVKFNIASGGVPTYEVSYKGKAVVKPSRLGLELAKDKHASKGLDETDLLDDFRIKEVNESAFDETWTPVWGETKTIRNHYNEMAVTLVQTKEVPRYMGEGGAPGLGLEPQVREIIVRFRV